MRIRSVNCKGELIRQLTCSGCLEKAFVTYSGASHGYDDQVKSTMEISGPTSSSSLIPQVCSTQTQKTQLKSIGEGKQRVFSFEPIFCILSPKDTRQWQECKRAVRGQMYQKCESFWAINTNYHFWDLYNFIISKGYLRFGSIIGPHLENRWHPVANRNKH